MSITLRRSRIGAITAALVVSAGLVTANVANASHPERTLDGSSFEIDTNANLKVDHAPALDWAGVNDVPQEEEFTGSQDNSFGNGTKENTAVPSVVDGGIPPNKSDLTHFSVYQEGQAPTGFLNMFWSRVQDPSGTTNMDFELNKLYCDAEDADDDDCTSNGLTPERSEGDILITYDLSQGGTSPTISYRTWNDTSGAWRGITSLTTGGLATGSINNTSIPENESGGLGLRDPRTFGEAQVRLSALLGTQTPTQPSDCRSFGSVYLKSRSSDSFTAALKDFVAPVPANITNCGSVKVIKKAGSLQGSPLSGAGFTLYKDSAPTGAPKGAEDTVTFSDWTCTTAANGECTMVNVPPGGYWLVETTVPQGYDAVANQLVTVSGTATTTVGPLADPVATRTTTLSSAQSWVPNDTATVEVDDDQGALAGDMRFRLYDNATCADPVGPTGLLYDSGDIDITTGTANNSNDKFRRTLSSNNQTAFSTQGARSFYWLVTYISDNPNHTNIDGGCGIEASSLTIDNDTTN